ncbi:MAG: hypothetical protein ABI742_06405 [Gemmatimonadota bacterium]
MLRSRRILALINVVLLGASALTSCSTMDSTTAPTAAVAVPDANLKLPLLGGLLVCERQPYAITQKLIGPAGGTLTIGKHLLVIPAGALGRPTLITGEAPADFVSSVRFQPEGLQFLRPATLTLDYSSCPAARLQILKRVAYTTDKLDILSFLLSRDNLLLMRVSADLQHFSRYAVAW